MENYSIFIVEDDPWYGEILAYHLSLNPEYHVTRFESGKDCLSNLHKKPKLITIDYSLPDTTGAELFKNIRAVNPDIPVIVISGQEDINTAVELLKIGVTDYIVKDDNMKDLLWNAVIQVREKQDLKKEVEHLREELGQKYGFEKIIKGSSPCIQKVFSLMEKAAASAINVSVSGETGTGKELVAKAIHYNSERKKHPFVAVNMAAIPHELLESELFGHEKGAFTGAVARRIGKFEEANKGTLFLDEIGDMGMSLQSKLLRVLQERELARVGGNDTIKLDVRLIVATHCDLGEEVAKGRFREDLYYRVMGLPIIMPPLRERGNDILLLAKFFLDEFSKENKIVPRAISKEGKEKLMDYHFPGNVRELKAVMELAAIMCDKPEIGPEDINYNAPDSDNFLFTEEKKMKEYIRQIIRHYLIKYNNDVSLIAGKLDIGRSTIYKMIQQKEISL